MSTASVDVQIIDDALLEQNETFYATIVPLSLPHGVSLGHVTKAGVTIVDNECKYCNDNSSHLTLLNKQ